MVNQNKAHVKYSKLSHYMKKNLLRCFSEYLTAVQITKITSLNRNTVNRYMNLIREKIAKLCEQESPFSREVEVLELN